MSDLLLVNLRAVSPPAGEWLLWQVEQQRVLDSGSLEDAGAIDTLRNHSRQAACYVLVPGQQVVQLSVTLPVAGASAEAALPYQIEERLSSDLADVHLAHERIHAGKPCRVWVADKAAMAQWYRWLQDSGLRVKALLPDYAVLAQNTLLQHRRWVLVRLPDAGVTLERELFEQWWSLLDGETAVEQHLLVETDAPLDLGVEAREQPSVLAAIARHFEDPGMNLCQGDYVLHDPLFDTLKLLRWPAAAAALVLVVHWALLAADALQYSQKAQWLEAQVEDVYRETFPEAQRVVNARSQMKSHLRELEGQSGDAGFLPLMAPVATAFKGQERITLTQLVYQGENASLRLAIDAPDYAAVDALSARLQGQQLQVSRGTFRQNGEMISGQLSVDVSADVSTDVSAQKEAAL